MGNQKWLLTFISNRYLLENKFVMTSCILTVIKNEHEYLDEWIKYHLDLGVNHIFIFEDIDSESHKEICDKYGDMVSLDSVTAVLDEDEKKRVKEFKLTKKRNPQEIYFPKALTWIKNNCEHDWCFVIDIDEFITPYKSISEVLSEFEGYDGIVLQWKIFGANGHVLKPNYDSKGVLDIYTKESNYLGHSVLEWTTKTCYNLHTFKETYFKNNHQPSDECHWCRTDFSNIRTNIVYDKIYIKHYITKSWEEYISKRKRGYFMGFARTIDMFFRINQDMLPLKQELLDGLNKETLVVLPYKQSGSQGNEIRIALNGWRKFCQFNYRFVIIGEFDEQLKDEFPWVKFIECPTKEKKEGQYNPHLDIQNKFNVVSRMYSQIYNGFIYMSDDKYAIKPFNLDDITKTHYHASGFTGCEKAPTHFWSHDKWKTRQLLDREGLPHVNYTTHYPCYFEFKKLEEIRRKYNLLEDSYVFDDLYFNYFKHEEPVLDSTIRLGIWNNDIFKNDFQKAVDDPNIKFMCNSVEGWSKEFEDELKIITKNKQ